MRTITHFEMTQKDIDVLKEASFILHEITEATGRNLWTSDDLRNIGYMAKGLTTPAVYRLNATQSLPDNIFTFKEIPDIAQAFTEQ